MLAKFQSRPAPDKLSYLAILLAVGSPQPFVESPLLSVLSKPRFLSYDYALLLHSVSVFR